MSENIQYVRIDRNVIGFLLECVAISFDKYMEGHPPHLTPWEEMEREEKKYRKILHQLERIKAPHIKQVDLIWEPKG